MIIRRKSFQRIFLFLGTFASGISLIAGSAVADVASISPKQIFVNSCGKAVSKPTSLTQFCADWGTGVVQISWSTWGQAGASGAGTLTANSCDPYCAAGKIYKTDVKISLTGLKKIRGRDFLQNVRITPLGGTNFNLPPKMTNVPGGTSWTISQFSK